MITMKALEKQLEALDFSLKGWGRSEAKQLIHILHDDEVIKEVVNGFYEAGFAMLVATDERLILVDKKPLNYLTIEEVRYDMIAEIDFSHRLLLAHSSVATGNNKIMHFGSWNQKRLRKTITEVQHLMALAKKHQSSHVADQKNHLEQINQQLQAYLVAQAKQQQDLQEQLDEVKHGVITPEEVKIEPLNPSYELRDYLFAQSLLKQAKQEHPEIEVPAIDPVATRVIETEKQIRQVPYSDNTLKQIDELREAGLREVFGDSKQSAETEDSVVTNVATAAAAIATDKAKKERARRYGHMAAFYA